VIRADVTFTCATAVVEPIVETNEQYIRADISFNRIAAVVELLDAQGWRPISETPRFRAKVNMVELAVHDVYTLIVDKIDLSDNVITDDLIVFDVNKGLVDTPIAIESVAFEVTKPLSDSIVADETIVFDIGMPFSDTADTSDSTAYQADQGKEDSVTASDSAVFNMITDREGGVNDFAINEAAIGHHYKEVEVFTG
jgi:hypothetical protein